MKRGRSIALLNRSQLLAGCDREMRLMVAAGVHFVNAIWGVKWGFAPISGVYCHSAADVPKSADVFTWVDNDADVPDALGFHDQADNAPFATLLAEVILKEIGGGILDAGSAGSSCASVFGHELCELLVDEGCNDWTQMPDGRFLAKEACDPVQDGVVPVHIHGARVDMSDAVFPDYFDAQSPRGAPVSVLGFDKPFGCAPGGYQIVYDPSKLHSKDGPVQSIFGANVHPAIKRMKLNSARLGRTVRRTQRLAARIT